MSDSNVQVFPDSTGKKIDTEELAVGPDTVQRQRFQVTGAGATDIASVSSANGLEIDITRNQRTSSTTLANVSQSASNVTILASNTSRLGATIHNDGDDILYLKFGTTASTTSFTVKMQVDDYYEVPFGYTGIIDGIWASSGSGAARVTELEV